MSKIKKIVYERLKGPHVQKKKPEKRSVVRKLFLQFFRYVVKIFEICRHRLKKINFFGCRKIGENIFERTRERTFLYSRLVGQIKNRLSDVVFVARTLFFSRFS